MPAAGASVVVPVWNGIRWLPGLVASLRAQTTAPLEVIAVDNGSHDGSREWLAEQAPEVRVIALGTNTGFAVAANRGIAAALGEAVALVNTDVELEPAWLERALAALGPGVAAVATKMVDLADPAVLYDAGDVLRRDGVCEQRGRFRRDTGAWDEPGEVFAACAGAALYRRAAVDAAGGFDERFFSYLEDVDLGLRLRLAGWTCAWEPRAVARHAGGGSSGQLARPVVSWAERNTLLLAAKAFPLRWLPLVLYRQLAWAAAAARKGELRGFASGAGAALYRRSAVLAIGGFDERFFAYIEDVDLGLRLRLAGWSC
ncbi:MAG: glycosyl transferase, family 2, partial [Solirubrobacterales bacterium]|nr:glycosyl transferase, family 2 [Solirubrobacterales bacterium]